MSAQRPELPFFADAEDSQEEDDGGSDNETDGTASEDEELASMSSRSDNDDADAEDDDSHVGDCSDVDDEADDTDSLEEPANMTGRARRKPSAKQPREEPVDPDPILAAALLNQRAISRALREELRKRQAETAAPPNSSDAASAVVVNEDAAVASSSTSMVAQLKCVVITFKDGKAVRCAKPCATKPGATKHHAVSLRGTWELAAVSAKNAELQYLDVCLAHFNSDNNLLKTYANPGPPPQLRNIQCRGCQRWCCVLCPEDGGGNETGWLFLTKGANPSEDTYLRVPSLASRCNSIKGLLATPPRLVNVRKVAGFICVECLRAVGTHISSVGEGQGKSEHCYHTPKTFATASDLVNAAKEAASASAPSAVGASGAVFGTALLNHVTAWWGAMGDEQRTAFKSTYDPPVVLDFLPPALRTFLEAFASGDQARAREAARKASARGTDDPAKRADAEQRRLTLVQGRLAMIGSLLCSLAVPSCEPGIFEALCRLQAKEKWHREVGIVLRMMGVVSRLPASERVRERRRESGPSPIQRGPSVTARLAAGGAVAAAIDNVDFANETRTTEELAQHLTHVQAEHRWVSDFVATIGGSRVDRDGPPGTKLRGTDLRALVKMIVEVINSPGLPSQSPLFATTAFLGDPTFRLQLLAAHKKGADRMVSAINQFAGFEPENTTGARTVDIPIAPSVASMMRRRKPKDTDADRIRAALSRSLEVAMRQIESSNKSAEERKVMLREVLDALKDFPPTLAGLGGEKLAADKASTMDVVAEWAGPTVESDLHLLIHAFDGLQFMMKEAAVSAKRTLRAIAQRLVQAMLRCLPKEAIEAFFCYDRLSLVPEAKTSTQKARSAAVANIDGAAQRRMAAVIGRGVKLTPETVIDTAWLAADRQFRQACVRVIAEELLNYPWPQRLTVTVDSELESDHAAPPVTVERGVRRPRPEWAHSFGEADAAMWHFLRVRGQGGVAHTADADATEYGLEVCVHDKEPRPQYVIRYPTPKARTVNVTRLAQAIENGKGATSTALLPESWTPIQRVRFFVLAKVLGGNDYTGPLGVRGAVVLRTAIANAQIIGPLCDTNGAGANVNNMHRLILRVFYDLSLLRNSAKVFPSDIVNARSTDDMQRAHEEFQAAVGQVFRQRSDRPTAHGLVPSFHATRLTIARATTYANYVHAVVTPSVPFTGWTAPDSGYMKLGSWLLLHWDNNAEGKPVLGPKEELDAALASAKRERQPLSAVPSQTETVHAPRPHCV